MTAPANVPVTQEDRERAGDFVRTLLASGEKSTAGFPLGAFEYRNGSKDATPLVQAFARHRLAALASQPTDALREALRTADWKDGLAEAYRVLLDARRSLLEEKDRNTHLKGVYEPVMAALEPALAEVGELFRARALSADAPASNEGGGL